MQEIRCNMNLDKNNQGMFSNIFDCMHFINKKFAMRIFSCFDEILSLFVFPPEGWLGLRGRRHDPSQKEEENLWPDGKRWHHKPGRLREQRAQFVPVTSPRHNRDKLSLSAPFQINENKSPKYVRGKEENPSRVAFAFHVTLWTSQCQGHSSAVFIFPISRPIWGRTAGPDACDAAFSSVNLENRLSYYWFLSCFSLSVSRKLAHST